MKNITLVIALFFSVFNSVYAGHLKSDDVQQTNHDSDVTVSISHQQDKVERATTEGRIDVARSGDAELIDQHQDVFDTYNDLDNNLGF